MGDKVFLRNGAKVNKLSDKWLGPYEVVKTHGSLNTSIRIANKIRKVHNNRLKK